MLDKETKMAKSRDSKKEVKKPKKRKEKKPFGGKDLTINP